MTCGDGGGGGGDIAAMVAMAAMVTMVAAAVTLLPWWWHADRAPGVGDLIQQPRPLDGWRQDRDAPRLDNGWLPAALNGVEPSFVQDYYAQNNARL